MSKILAFGHRSGVGKDTAVSMASRLLTGQCCMCDKYSFANSLKLECYSLFGTLPPATYEQYRSLRSTKVEGLDLNVVELWVKFGEACRQIDPLIWVKQCMKAIENDSKYNEVALISDLRHPNEATSLKKSGAILIKVESNVPDKPEALVDQYLKEYDAWDYEIYAEQGDLVTLEAEVKRVLQSERLLDE
jgi:hypothetical protein